MGKIEKIEKISSFAHMFLISLANRVRFQSHFYDFVNFFLQKSHYLLFSFSGHTPKHRHILPYKSFAFQMEHLVFIFEKFISNSKKCLWRAYLIFFLKLYGVGIFNFFVLEKNLSDSFNRNLT